VGGRAGQLLDPVEEASHRVDRPDSVNLARQSPSRTTHVLLAIVCDCHTTFNLKNLKAAISMTYRSTRYLINDTLLDKFAHLPTSYLRIVS
jgi:hypothetical protein